MKTKATAAVMIGFIAVILFSCNRGNQVVPAQTMAQTIVGKWALRTAVMHTITQSDEWRDTTSFNSIDYFNFKADGTLSIVVDTGSYSGKWAVISDKVVITETNYIDFPGGFTAPRLTAHQLQLYYPDTTASTSSEQWLNFTR